jgi:hypothetical protein
LCLYARSLSQPQGPWVSTGYELLLGGPPSSEVELTYTTLKPPRKTTAVVRMLLLTHLLSPLLQCVHLLPHPYLLQLLLLLMLLLVSSVSRPLQSHTPSQWDRSRLAAGTLTLQALLLLLLLQE